MRNALLILAIIAGFAARAHSADLNITVTGAQPGEGQMLVGVFDNAQGFLKTPVKGAKAQVDGNGRARVTLTLPPGRYAIAVTYDQNGNGEMDRRALGLPAEPFGFSNNARVRFGPPAFDKAAFALTAAGKAVTIRLDRVK